MLVKSDFISKLTIKSEASNSKTSLANEKESFIVYSLFVSGLSNWSQNLASLKCFKCYVKEKRKCSFENALVEKSESSTDLK